MAAVSSSSPRKAFRCSDVYSVSNNDSSNALGPRSEIIAATHRATFTRNSTVWSVGGNDQYKLGPAIDRWVDPASTGAHARSVQVSTSEGRAKVAVKVTDLGSNRWRYDCAVMNLDSARTQTVGAEPTLRVSGNLGFDGFTVPIGLTTITDLTFNDDDGDASNDWSASVRAGSTVSWTAPSGNALNWGTLFHFSFIANRGRRRAASTCTSPGLAPRPP